MATGPSVPPAPETPAQPHSCRLAADASLFPLWDASVPYPAFDEMPDLDVVTHVSVERAAPDGYRYLHGTALAFWKGALHLGWTNGREGEVNVEGEVVRGKRSTDGGLSWGPASLWAEPPALGAVGINHPVLAVHEGRLWGFFTAWNDRKPRTEIFWFNDSDNRWAPADIRIPGFVPFNPPQRLGNGAWIIPGENFWYEASAALCRDDAWTRWDVVPIPHPADMAFEFPETTLLDQGDRLLAVCRPKGMPTALVSVSLDHGRSWSLLHPSNFPMAPAKPCARRLSTGQHLLLTNHLEEKRTLLTLAVAAPGSRVFSRIWKLRHQATPKRRLYPGVYWHGKLMKPMLGTATEWSYPCALEHEGHLVVSYTQGKEDACVSVIPLRVLA
jgi:hypothetical protein